LKINKYWLPVLLLRWIYTQIIIKVGFNAKNVLIVKYNASNVLWRLNITQGMYYKGWILRKACIKKVEYYARMYYEGWILRKECIMYKGWI